jgi:hypothetical protein
MAGARDVDGGQIVAALDGARAVDGEQFRMQGPAVELKDELGNFRSDGEHGVETPAINRKANQLPISRHYKRVWRVNKETFSRGAPDDQFGP